MGEILLLEELADEVLENDDGLFTLFGKREYVTLWEKKHDFIFHAIKSISFEDLKPSSLMVVPVLPHRYYEESGDAKVYMSELFSKKPFLSTFALRVTGDELFSVEGENRAVGGNFLTFFETKQGPYGVEVSEKDGYARTNKQKLERDIPNWKEFQGYLDRLSSDINTEYGF